MTAISVIATIMALGATVCAFIFVVPEKKGRKKIMQILHDIVNFKTLIIEKVIQATYIFATAFCMFSGFCMLFWFETRLRYSYSYGYVKSGVEWHGLEGILMMIAGPIAIRLAYEVILLAIIAVKNIIQINSKLKNQNEGEVVDAFAMPKIEKAPKAAPAAPAVTTFCTECGARKENGVCPNCGK